MDSLDDPLIAAAADRISYLCHKGVVNHNQAFWQLNDLLTEHLHSLTEAERFEVTRTIQQILDGRSRRSYRSESTIVAARVPRRVVQRIDDFASAYQLTRSQCLGLALDLVYGQDWQLETEPWKRTKHIYAGETLPGLSSRSGSARSW